MYKEMIHTKRPILQVIRAKCIDCCCGDRSEVKRCAITDCDLHPYRLGKNPFSTRGAGMTQDRRDAAAEQLAEYRKRKKKEDAS
jgi:hypothetical protein|tara:strand:- start:5082 stop:5333 length:252 start_codon:yes stop_codon:yes gene_type:complete